MFEPTSTAGPNAIGRGEGFSNSEILALASSIVARYCDRNGASTIEINYRQIPQEQSFQLNSLPLEPNGLEALKVNR